jgi:prephenate dehydratase
MKKVFYLGPEGSYSHIAVTHALVGDYQYVSCASFLEIVNNTLFTNHALGILPIENSITSDIHENIDYLFKNNFFILQEVFLSIHLHLIGLPTARLSEITTVCSHPRALAQCTKFIAKHSLKIQETTSTAIARDIVVTKQDPHMAAIGSRELLQDAVQLLAENIGNDSYNLTRFVCIGIDHREYHAAVHNKATIIFKVLHTPGSLAKVLHEFAKTHVNLTKIESRPIPGTKWEYIFWVDLENDETDIDVAEIKTILEKNTVSYTIIGTYQTGKIIES